MKVAVIGGGTPPPPFISQQIAAMEKSGLRVDLFPEPERHKFLSGKLLDLGVTKHLAGHAIDLLKDADILHFQWPMHLWHYKTVVRKLQKPVVLSLRGRQVNILPYVPGNESFVEKLREAMRLADAYHCVSNAMVLQGSEFGLIPSRAHVVHTAVDTEFFSPGTKNGESAITIVMVGALIWRKGYEFALMALASLIKKGLDVKLEIVGEGQELDRVTYTASDLGIADRVRLLGKGSREDVRRALRGGDIFLLASLSEGLANAAVEAMSCGLPVVVTDVGGMQEAVEDGVEGYVVPPRAVHSMSERLAALCASPENRREMGCRGRQKVVRLFNPDVQADKLRAMYEAVIAG